MHGLSCSSSQLRAAVTLALGLLLLGFAPNSAQASHQASHQAPRQVHQSHMQLGQAESMLTRALDLELPPETSTLTVTESGAARHETRGLTFAASDDRVWPLPLVQNPDSPNLSPPLTQQAAAAEFRVESLPVKEAEKQTDNVQREAPVSLHAIRVGSGLPGPQVPIQQIGKDLTEQRAGHSAGANERGGGGGMHGQRTYHASEREGGRTTVASSHRATWQRALLSGSHSRRYVAYASDSQPISCWLLACMRRWSNLYCSYTFRRMQ